MPQLFWILICKYIIHTCINTKGLQTFKNSINFYKFLSNFQLSIGFMIIAY